MCETRKMHLFYGRATWLLDYTLRGSLEVNYSCHIKSSGDIITYGFSNSGLSVTSGITSSFYCLIHYTSQMVLFYFSVMFI